MSNLFELISPDRGLKWEVSPIGKYYHHVNCYDGKTGLSGSGFAASQNVAKEIALAELNERSVVCFLSNSNQQADWRLDFDASCSGFAVGWTHQQSLKHAICEATERWALANWIDRSLCIEDYFPGEDFLSILGISSTFEAVSHWKKEVAVPVNDQILNISIVVTVGWTKNGAFAGYGAKTDSRNAIVHSVIEALRNFSIYSNQGPSGHFPYNRIAYFANSKSEALEIVGNRRESLWPMPVLSFLRTDNIKGLWITRAIFDGWEPWQKGPINRFLY